MVREGIWSVTERISLTNSIFGIPKLELSKELSAVSKPVYEDKLPENVHIAPYHSNIIPGSFAFCHINKSLGIRF